MLKMNDIDKYSDLVVKHDQIVDSLKLWLVNNYVKPPFHIIEDLNKCYEEMREVGQHLGGTYEN